MTGRMAADPGAMTLRPIEITEHAHAKINLCLHVTGRRADGYHLLDSLVMFPEIGDRLTVEAAETLSLALDGPFAAELDAGPENLVLRAAEELRQGPAGAAILLQKNLPITSGMGGGSADAAATLRALTRLWGFDPDSERLAALALELGADVPVCLAQRSAFMSGVGERLAPAPATPEFWLVLVNPLVATSTAEVFAALTAYDNAPLSPAPAKFRSLDELSGWLMAQRNDLEPPAKRLRPVIGEALDALQGRVGSRFARMTGSGATCFAPFAAEAAALAAANEIRARRPDWWVAAARVPAYDPGKESA